VKAKPVKKLDPSRSLGENAARIIQVRLDEMEAFAPRALDGKMKAQHDMRIAAKRLRYVLEVTGFAFGQPADTARRRARDLQDILGEIHDCDVMLPRVREHQKQLQRGDARAVRKKAGKPRPHPRLAARALTGRGIAGSTCSPYLEARRACSGTFRVLAAVDETGTGCAGGRSAACNAPARPLRFLPPSGPEPRPSRRSQRLPPGLRPSRPGSPRAGCATVPSARYGGVPGLFARICKASEGLGTTSLRWPGA
jgi:hypothetical protein